MTLRHPGISPTNDLVAKKIFSNPEITCQFIRDMLDLPAKNVTILEGSNIHVLPSLPYSAQDFYTSIDVLAELDNGTQVIIEIQVHHQNFFINRLWAYLCSQVNQNLEKIRQREGDTHQSYKHIAPVYAIAIVDSNYFSDDLAFHSFSMREDTTGEVLTITNNGQENHLVKMAFLELGIEQGIEKGLERGLERGKLFAFLDMVRQGLLTSEVASHQLGMSVAEFEELLKEHHK
ncbi:hypothetical protein SPPN_11035 [Streptococcus pseudopneumoniae IS7493]|nr:PD-(D/E)XK nuclease family transposase [Streptococcus pseudopneumoniae]AEL11611.1 hypothetical protein SPPN_11035 [Streptococcus pseudopneumoniae IS7493]